MNLTFRPHYGPESTQTNRNDYQENFLAGKGDRWVGLTTLPLSFADCLDVLEPQPPGILRACPGVYTDSFSFPFTYVNLTYWYIRMLLEFHSESNRFECQP